MYRNLLDLHIRTFQHLTQFQGEPSSPQPSIDRLSVTFAEDSQRSDISSRCNLFNPNSLSSPVTSENLQFPPLAGKPKNFLSSAHQVKVFVFVKSNCLSGEENSDDEDYSASVTAIMQHRASSCKSRKKGNRRASSPFSPDVLPCAENGRRRSSVFTTSSGEYVREIFENTISIEQSVIGFNA